MRKIIFRVIAGVLGIGLALALVEVWARFNPSVKSLGLYEGRYMESDKGKFYRYDRLLGWSGIPWADADYEWADCLCRVRQNRFGFRGPDYDFTRTSKKRIAVLGDSLTWGFGVDNSELFTHFMERKSKIPIEVLNLAVSGYGTDQELLVWRSMGYKWQPDVVLLVVTVANDFQDIRDKVGYGHHKPLFVWSDKKRLELLNVPVPAPQAPWYTPGAPRSLKDHAVLRGIVRHSAAAKVLIAHFLGWRPLRIFLESNAIVPFRIDAYEDEFPIYQYPFGPGLAAGVELFSHLLAALKAETAAHGARLILVVVPTATQVYPRFWKQVIQRLKVRPGSQVDLEAANREVLTQAARHGLPVIDLLPGLRQAGSQNPNLYFPFNLHWTPAGHQVVAELLLSGLSHLPDEPAGNLAPPSR
jgi:lysophospholipase L1-like esterase